MKNNTRKTTKKGTARKVKQPAYGLRELTDEQQREVEAIDRTGDALGNAAVNFWTGIYYAPPFIQTAINDALTRAAASLGIANPATEDDPITKLKKLLALYKVTGAEFTLDRTPENLKQKAREMIVALEDPTPGADSPRMEAAHEYGEMLHAAITRGRVLDMSYVLRMLPVVLEINQEMAEIDAQHRRSDAAARGAQTRKRNT